MKPVRVIKLGGSLLTMPNLSAVFHRWCRANPHPLTLVIVGGGAIVDAVRQINDTNPLDEQFAHWLCMDLLQHTARLAHRILGDVEIYETAGELQQAFSAAKTRAYPPVIAIAQVGIAFARNRPNQGLPASWEVTSDTLAAAFCERHAAAELVVMKSRDLPPGSTDFEGLARLGFVDPQFADFAENIETVRFVNLRTF